MTANTRRQIITGAIVGVPILSANIVALVTGNLSELVHLAMGVSQ